MSLDGKIAEYQGDNKSLGGSGDRLVLEEALSRADATLMGCKTLLAHKSTCLIHNKKLIDNRLLNGMTKQPISIVIGKNRNIPRDLKYFDQPIERWLINSEEMIHNKNSYNKFEKIFTFRKNWVNTFNELNRQSKNKIENLVVLGGSKLITSLINENLIDQIQITLCPKIIGGNFSWISKELKINNADNWTLEESKILTDNEIMLLYSR